MANLAQIWATKIFFQIFFFFYKNLNPSVTRYHGQLSSCTISEKTNNPILRKLSDGQTDEWVDGQVGWRRTDEQTKRQTDRQE